MNGNFYAKQLLLLIVFFLAPVLTFGQIYSNTFTGASACPTPGNVATPISGVTGTALTRSITTCTAFSNAFNSTTLNNTATINNNSYIEFSVTADAGSQLNVTSLSFFRQGSATAPNQLEIRYSTDGFATSTAWGAAPLTVTSPGATTTWNFDDFTVASGVKLTFRIYPYGTQRADLGTARASARGSFRLDNVTLNGTVISAMPVKLSFFEGTFENNTVLLKWETTQEDQNEGFEVQRSIDAIIFNKVGYVEGNGTTRLKSVYEFSDTGIKSGQTFYYRLKQIDLDGSYEYSRIIDFKSVSGMEKLYVYPNPTTGIFEIKLTDFKNPEIRLFDQTGREVPIKITKSENPDSYQITIQGTQTPGIFELKINDKQSNSRSKSVKISVIN
ncbi:T9SS type A sorting domain-containing protein [Dyadobacter sp. CY356]|uniref:T9SS type A sorting domain-containing protein n=1 Tax=Dyadobacter sp. CY356 TaxID=2906442 RepID=UPI001F20D3A1|nr:T9SS type A sorting domain-containing protein [Dyadobacter sp. CY356]MCF0056590.1 T9SS type A sorting domain-containing protein [Dyadobacter sp. CY356]